MKHSYIILFIIISLFIYSCSYIKPMNIKDVDERDFVNVDTYNVNMDNQVSTYSIIQVPIPIFERGSKK